MTLNLPYKVRLALYVLTAVGTPVIAYLFAKEVIGELEVQLWAAEVSVVSILAALNVTPSEEEL